MSTEELKKDKYEVLCGNCSNLLKLDFMGKKVCCCGGNVDHPEICGLRKKNYEIKVKDSIFKIPKENIKLLAITKALDNGITHDNIHDEETAIEYLESLGMEIKEVY